MKKHPLFPSIILTAMLALCVIAPRPSHAEPNFGNYSSADLTTNAWKAFNAKNYKDTLALTGQCIQSFKSKAMEQQHNKMSPHPSEEFPWALNDVATCFYIQGMTHEAMGKKDEAMKDYQFVVDKLNLAVCQGDKGTWYPFQPCQENLAKLAGVDPKKILIVTKVELSTVSVRSTTANIDYKVTGSTQVQVRGMTSSVSELKPGMSVVVTTGTDTTVATKIVAP